MGIQSPILPVAALALLLFGGASVYAQQAPALSGQWVSAAAENYGPVVATRSFSFSDQSWRVSYRAYATDPVHTPLFTLNVGGIYVLGGPSKTVADAFEGVFPADHRHITADSDAGVKMFADMGCVLERGKETPLLSQGCGFVPGLMQAMGEYDLVALRDGRLYLGDRTGDLSKNRPTQLTSYPLIRQSAD